MPPPDLTTTLPASGATDTLPGRGAAIGRYLVLSSLGMGATGVVFSVYDPDLDRKVALKVLRADLWPAGASSSARESVVREAQAMARVSHPNVVHVYEVGFTEQGAYVAMEQVQGTTLRTWMEQKGRRWESVLDMLLAAGAGLAAAHRAGVVHQDFKPENVLVGDDGRPRVSDFGLAGTSIPGAGTRAYMAPEQRARETVDARTDQYAFCVTVWEALQGERPSAVPSLPAQRAAPAWIYRALARGLATEPAARWPSLDALLAVLHRRTRLAARLLLGAGAAVAIGLTAFLVGRLVAAPPACAGAEARLAGVWDPVRRDEVRAAVAATGFSYGGGAFRVASALLDEYARNWVAMHTEACRATRVEARQSDTLLDLRMACLERRRAVLGRLTQLWAKGMDAAMLEAAVDTAGRLPALAECADARALTERAPMPRDPAVVARITRVRGEIDAAQALHLANRWREARKVAATARSEADATAWVQVRAEAAFAEGSALAKLTDLQAEPLLLEAARLAGMARDDRLAARALIDLADHLGEHQRDAGRGLLAAEMAAAVVARAGEDVELRVRLLVARGSALLTAGQLDGARATFTRASTEAVAAFGARHPLTLQVGADLVRVSEGKGEYAEARVLAEKNLAATIDVLGGEHPRVAAQLNNLAIIVKALGDLDAAVRHHRRALAIKEKVFGGNSASTALTMNNLGITEAQRGNLNAAEALLERALAIRERVLGREHPFVATTLQNLATVRRQRGRFAEALALLERVLAIKTKAYGPEHATIANALFGIGLVLSVKGEPEAALPHARRALEIRRKRLGPEHVRTLNGMARLAAALAGAGRCPEARPLLARAQGGLEKAKRAASTGAFEALVTLGRCQLAEGAPLLAVESLERALAIADRVHALPVERGAARWPLARALWMAQRREAALAAARRAEQELRGNADGARSLAALRAWRAAHER